MYAITKHMINELLILPHLQLDTEYYNFIICILEHNWNNRFLSRYCYEEISEIEAIVAKNGD